MITKEEILEKAHLNESSELCRTYFKEKGLFVIRYPFDYFYKLRKFIQEETYPLLIDKSYQMISELRMVEKIQINNKYAYLFTAGSYFDKREAISFDFRKKFIGFCGWASGCNRLPFIRGFIKWCDWLVLELNKTNQTEKD
jgi:hypothetical protein